MTATAALTWILKLGLGGVLVVAGALKLIDGVAFAEQIANYKLFPALAPLLAVLLPTTEILVGVVLGLAPRRSPWTPAAALAGALLMAMFAGAVAHVVFRGIDVSCGCFGGASGGATGWTLARNIGLLAASALTFWLTQRQRRYLPAHR